MITVDASVWVSLLIDRDVNHPATLGWLQVRERGGESMVAPVLLLTEVAGAVTRRTGLPQLGERAIADILGERSMFLVPLDRPLAEEAARLAAALRLRGADAVYVAVARRLGAPLVTWDRQQRERAAIVVEARAPAPPAPDSAP